MTTPLKQHAAQPESLPAPVISQQGVEKPAPRPTPIAYEEVILTEEAANLLDELHKAAITTPKKAVRLH